MELRTLVSQALRESTDGVRLLLSPNMFWGSLADLGIDNLPEANMLQSNCDSQLLGPYYEASQAEESERVDSLRRAAKRGAHLLDDKGVKQSIAVSIADGIAGGIADFQGLEFLPSDESNLDSHKENRNNEKKNSRPNGILVAAVIAIVAIIASGAYLLVNMQAKPKIWQRSGSSSYSSSSTQKESSAEVGRILAEAEQQASEDDYEGAFRIIKNGLDNYPDSNELSTKSEEFGRKRDEIDNVIDRAENNATNNSFDRALDVVDAGLKDYPKSKKLTETRDSISKRRDSYNKQAELEVEEAQKRSEQKIEKKTVQEPEIEQKKQEQAPYQSVAGLWFGSYTGNSLDVNGAHIPVKRMLWFDLEESGGQISGTCSVGKEDGSNSVEGSYYVSGTYDHDTGEITISGTEWISTGDLQGMRNFWGAVEVNRMSMGGLCQGTSSGEIGDWQASMS